MRTVLARLAMLLRQFVCLWAASQPSRPAVIVSTSSQQAAGSALSPLLAAVLDKQGVNGNLTKAWQSGGGGEVVCWWRSKRHGHPRDGHDKSGVDEFCLLYFFELVQFRPVVSVVGAGRAKQSQALWVGAAQKQGFSRRRVEAVCHSVCHCRISLPSAGIWWLADAGEWRIDSLLLSASYLNTLCHTAMLSERRTAERPKENTPIADNAHCTRGNSYSSSNNNSSNNNSSNDLS